MLLIMGTLTTYHPNMISRDHWIRRALRVCPLVDHHFSKCARKCSVRKSAASKRYRSMIWLRVAKVMEVKSVVTIFSASSRIAYTKRLSHRQKLLQKDRPGKPSRCIRSSLSLLPRTSQPRPCNIKWVVSFQQPTMATVNYLPLKSSTMTPAQHSK